MIGCGSVTEVKSGPAFNKVSNSALCMVMRRDEEKLKDYATRHGVDNYTTNYLDILNDKEINAVYIATPPNMHCFYTKKAAEYKKDVYVEKPMAVSVDECKEMIEVCKENDVNLYVAYYRRGHKKFKTIKEIIDTSQIGDVSSFNYVYTREAPSEEEQKGWRFDKKIAGDGLFYDVGSHMIDTMQLIFGEFNYASGTSHKQANNQDISDTVNGVIFFKSGVQGCANFVFNSDSRRDEFIIYGTKGTISFSVMAGDFITLALDGKESVIEFEPLTYVQMPLINHIVDDLNGLGVLEHEGTYGLRTQEVLEAFSNSESVKF